jgi:hypothetical protein
MNEVFNKKVLYQLGFILTMFWIPITGFVYMGMYSFSIIYFGVVTTLVAIIKPYYLISLYIYFLPLSALIGTKNNFLGIIGFDEITQIGIIYFLFTFRFKKARLNKLQIYSKRAILLIIAYYLYYTSKGILLGYEVGYDYHNLNYVMKMGFKLSLKYGPYLMLIFLMYHERIRMQIFPAIFLSIATIILSMPIVEILNGMGFMLTDVTYSLSEVEGGALRSRGFYNAGGDENSLAGFSLIAFGFYLGIYEQSKNIRKFLPIFGLLIIGLFMTASRTGIISLALILLIFLSKNVRSNTKAVMTLAAFGGIFFLLASPIILAAISRFYANSFDEALDKDQVGRLGYYYVYGVFFIENPETMIAGYTDTTIWYKRSPHNFFILMLYNAGFVFPTLLMAYLYKIFRWGKRIVGNHRVLYMIIPYFLILSTINSEGAGIYFWFFISGMAYLQVHAVNEKTSQPLNTLQTV